MPDDLLDRAHSLATHGPLRVELVTIAAEPAEAAQLRERQLAAIVRLLRDELARSVDSGDDERQAELARLAREREEIDRALYRQALRLEEHDDPTHPSSRSPHSASKNSAPVALPSTNEPRS